MSFGAVCLLLWLSVWGGPGVATPLGGPLARIYSVTGDLRKHVAHVESIDPRFDHFELAILGDKSLWVRSEGQLPVRLTLGSTLAPYAPEDLFLFEGSIFVLARSIAEISAPPVLIALEIPYSPASAKLVVERGTDKPAQLVLLARRPDQRVENAILKSRDGQRFFRLTETDRRSLCASELGPVSDADSSPR